MTGKTFRIIKAVLAMVLAIAAGWSVVTQNYNVLVITILIAVGLVYVLRRKTKEILKDERSALLYEKAAGSTVRFCVPAIAIGSAVIALLGDKLALEMVSVSYTLAYTACAFLLAHAAFYSYYSRKH
jgi:uncharacterized membrane protein